MEDNKIISLYEKRDEKAIKETDKKYGRYCTGIAYNILCDSFECDEVVNDTYLKAWNSIPPQKPKILRSFLGRITRGLSIDRLRKKTAEKRGAGEYTLVLHELEECIEDKQSCTEKSLDSSMLTEILNGFIESLSSTERKIFLCRYWYFDSVKAIAEQFGYSESKIKSMLFRTRNKLKTLLEKEGFIF